MGFFEKVKNMFTEEVEDDDVKVEQIKKEVTHVKIETPIIEKNDEEIDIPIVEQEPKISKPVFFDDNDFKDLKLVNEEKDNKDKEKELYGGRIQEPDTKVEKKSFKPTPIISPVYGVLDKNYHKEDIVSKNDTLERNESKISSIDAVRNKAYGTLEDELENTLFGSNSILFKKDEKEDKDKLDVKEIDDDLLSGFTEDISKKLDELLIKKEKNIDNLVYDNEAYEKSNKDKSDGIDDDDLLGFIDSTLYKDRDE